MTKFMDDLWMRENGFTEKSWEAASIGELLRRLPRRETLVAEGGHTVRQAVEQMKESGVSQLPVVSDGQLIGIVTEHDMLSKIVDGKTTLESKVAEVMFRHVETVHVHDDAGKLLDLFAKQYVGVVVEGNDRVVGVLTKMDLVDHLTAAVSAN